MLLPAVTAAVVAAAAGAAWAFLAWGPVGLGNGPVFLPAASGEGFGWTDLTGQPAAVIVPVINAGHATAVVDSVSVQSGLSDVPARALAIKAGRFTRFPCQAIGPLHASVVPSGPRRGHLIPSALTGCVRPRLSPIAGLAIAPGTNAMGIGGWPVSASPAAAAGIALVVVLAPPSPGHCWYVAAVVIRYHVGSRHYTSTSPLGQTFACAPARPGR